MELQELLKFISRREVTRRGSSFISSLGDLLLLLFGPIECLSFSCKLKRPTRTIRADVCEDRTQHDKTDVVVVVLNDEPQLRLFIYVQADQANWWALIWFRFVFQIISHPWDHGKWESRATRERRPCLWSFWLSIWRKFKCFSPPSTDNGSGNCNHLMFQSASWTINKQEFHSEQQRQLNNPTNETIKFKFKSKSHTRTKRRPATFIF